MRATHAINNNIYRLSLFNYNLLIMPRILLHVLINYLISTLFRDFKVILRKDTQISFNRYTI